LSTATTLLLAIVTILPLKQLAALKLPRWSIFASQPKSPSSIDPTPLPPTPGEILTQIGGRLRQSREQRNMSIEDISVRTRIQPRLLRAIEEGHIEMLPEAVYVKGMVKQYGDSIGLNGVEISQQVPQWEKESMDFNQLTAPQTTGFSKPEIKPLPVYLGYAVAIFGICGISSFLLTNALNSKHASGGGVVEKNQLAAAPTAIPARVVAPRSTQLPDVPISVVVKSPAWAQIGVDGATKFTGNLQVGAQLNLTATKQVTISTNNAGGLLFSRDRQPPQLLGKSGEKQQVTIKVSK
jgi:cytoskeletal protein RodZ